MLGVYFEGYNDRTGSLWEIVLSSFLPISKKEIQSLLPDISVSTIEKVLSNMIKDGEIEKIGETYNARYIKKKV